ncbi:LysR family transcriptional regulator [Vibrio mangrovi]|uniref:HTH-type transcriptional regulator CysL n=1 Tax=Vibrio mangrovi TaxID=474394 RepID=A0A1Y6J0U8_9VIBR|nr:LysR family transcriptional regulator [Vibrio mangrovi]MDW6002554.1 LysR family transcriptional regulator [Vibrio mangrovi]SMS01913.1 HTH-type transcriptional regulator CysL [Vibrio mangrovi]
MLNPVWLNTFKTLIETGHFTRTAEKLFMTQPGVSQHIQKLEEACGHKLLQRFNKSFEITEQGRMVYQYARQLEQGEATLLDRLNFHDPYTGQYRIACSGALALFLYPRLLEIQQQHPRLVIHLESAPNHAILKGIQAGEIDIGLVASIPNKSLFDAEQLCDDPLCLALPKENTFQSAPCQTLMKLGLIRHPDVDHYLSLYLADISQSVISSLKQEDIPVSGYINQINQILIPVSRGLGFTVLPQFAVESFSDAAKLDIIKSDQSASETLYLVKKHSRKLPERFHMINHQVKSFLTHYDEYREPYQ